MLDRGTTQMAKLIHVAVQDGASMNPWNTDVGTASPVFKGSTPVVKARIRKDLAAHFRRWQRQQRAELVELKFVTPNDRDLVADLTYRDLETDRVESVPLTTAGA